MALSVDVRREGKYSQIEKFGRRTHLAAGKSNRNQETGVWRRQSTSSSEATGRSEIPAKCAEVAFRYVFVWIDYSWRRFEVGIDLHMKIINGKGKSSRSTPGEQVNSFRANDTFRGAEPQIIAISVTTKTRVRSRTGARSLKQGRTRDVRSVSQEEKE
ncbi:uncharacterized protein BO95DRAFT_135938 [Aspergillus brunneoviolaceus CBS 621.78]|uniref:Uncharacterized protein n=1 Tax=Aspergillus brunneoviolaceus CBS 621.78 TaxID=1450534 RepID=A0ACD1G8S1_9EURO|nr:hypothetical protein BO95DRAFT_135938 [Aspergillus brunneoviolaceus CBS 621.78]RAH45577.1 hypothetical protein BO95DRAFT_135938 [Aspergillus brunneoviolaceus CBS 621.78]